MKTLGFTVQMAVAGSGLVAHVQLENPPGNRLGLQLLEGLEARLRLLHESSNLRAVYLTATGDDFSHGVDLRDPKLAEKLMSGASGRMEVAALGQRLIDLWATLPVPTVVAARGWVIGAGACLFTASDFRFAVGDARIRFPEVRHGMHLSWGILPRMVEVFGPAQARWLALAGDTLTMDQLGHGDGVVRIVDNPEDEAQRLAEYFASEAPLAVRAVKHTLAEVSTLNSGPSLQDPQRFADTIGSEDFAEAVAAFFAHRPAQFKGR